MNLPRLWRAVLSYGLGSLLVLQGLGVLIPTSTHAASPIIKINEINWAGSPGDPADQWIELHNVSGSAINFGTDPYTVTIHTATPQVIHLDGTYGTLTDDSFLVISTENLATSTLKSLPAVSYHQESFTLDATPHQVLDIANDADPVPVDSVNASAGTATPPASMSRVDIAASASMLDTWYTSYTIGGGFDSTVTAQYGTPGLLNLEQKKPTATVTPEGSVTQPVDPSVGGHSYGPATQANIAFANQCSNTLDRSYTVPTSGGSFNATASGLSGGRYAISAYTNDANGSRSQTTMVPAKSGDTDSNYVVIPAAGPAQPNVDAVPGLTNQPTVTIHGTPGTGDPYSFVDIVRNGSYYGEFPITDFTGSGITVSLIQNQTNTFQVLAVRTTCEFSLPATITVVSDSQAPDPVNLAKVTVNSNPPGTHDSFSGQTGAAEANTTLFVYGDAALTQLIAQLTVQGDGSFAQVDIGDNLHSSVYLVLQDAAGNRSTAARVNNPTGFTTNGALAPHVSSVGQTSVDITWTKVDNAQRYRVKYKVAGGTYGATTDLCINGNNGCPFATSLANLFTDTDYVFAIAAIDQFGNQSPYEEVTFHTKAAPVPAPVAIIEKLTPKAKAATRTTTDTVTKVAPTPTPTATPESGDVKSESTQATRNWTPWIVLGVLVAIAVLATAGYFYWFGGEAGEAALASVLSERAKREEEDGTADKKSKAGPKPKKGGGSSNRRW